MAKHEGWTVLPTLYDDGGFSGGTMQRPALKRLIIDIEAGQFEARVVRKTKLRIYRNTRGPLYGEAERTPGLIQNR